MIKYPPAKTGQYPKNSPIFKTARVEKEIWRIINTIASIWNDNIYYHLRSTVKRERFFAHVHFSNETVSQTTVSTGPMKMFRLEHETMNVCQRNVARFGNVECMFDKVNDIFPGFGSLMSLRLQKDGRTIKSKQIWTNLSHWNTDTQTAKTLVVRSYIFFLII